MPIHTTVFFTPPPQKSKNVNSNPQQTKAKRKPESAQRESMHMCTTY
jgi:hypothetical protein